MTSKKNEPPWLLGQFFRVAPAGIRPVARWLLLSMGFALTTVGFYLAADKNAVILRQDRLRVQQADSASTRGGETFGALADLFVCLVRFLAYPMILAAGSLGIWILASLITGGRGWRWPAAGVAATLLALWMAS